jgi:hypothetical protein
LEEIKENPAIIKVIQNNLGDLRDQIISGGRINNMTNNIINSNNRGLNTQQARSSNNRIESNIDNNAIRNFIQNELIISNPAGGSSMANMMPYLPSNNDPNFNFPEISILFIKQMMSLLGRD